MNRRIFEEHVRKLSYVYPVTVDDEFHKIRVANFNPPPGYNWSEVDVILEIPRDYPESPPGVGNSRVYLPRGLLLNGETPKDFHETTGPEGWGWWCYEWIKWDPCNDDLIVFFELLRAHMTNQDANKQKLESVEWTHQASSIIGVLKFGLLKLLSRLFL